MTLWMAAALSLMVASIAVPCLVVGVQCLIAVLPRRRREANPRGGRPRVGVLVPAHDEETVLSATIASIRSQLLRGDRLLVVADNCTDSTARLATECGAEVLIRDDDQRRGKGFALQAGLDGLRSDPPEVVIVVDADCRLQPGCVDALAWRAAVTKRPVQARYLMAPPLNPRPADMVSSLAVLVKNRVRPLAMAKLGLPCLITGSGSAFPWQALQLRSFAGAHIVEDMQMAVDLALCGFPTSYCDEAVALAVLPERASAFLSQRRRWEHGHLQILATQVPRLLVAFLRSGRLSLAAMMLDVAVPPLSLLVAAIVMSMLVSVLLGFSVGWWIPAMVIGAAAMFLAVGVGLAWRRFAADSIPLSLVLAVPGYILRKLPLYWGFVFHRERSWVRTARNPRGTNALE